MRACEGVGQVVELEGIGSSSYSSGYSSALGHFLFGVEKLPALQNDIGMRMYVRIEDSVGMKLDTCVA